MDKLLIAVQWDIRTHLKSKNNSVRSLLLFGNAEVPAHHGSFRWIPTSKPDGACTPRLKV